LSVLPRTKVLQLIFPVIFTPSTIELES